MRTTPMEKLSLSLFILLPHVIGLVAPDEQDCLDVVKKIQSNKKVSEILINSTVEVDCTINHTCGQYSSSDLYFTRYSSVYIEINPNLQVKLDNNSLGLRLRDTTLLGLGDKKITCHLRGVTMKHVRFKILDPPVGLEQMQCRVVDKSMTCGGWPVGLSGNCHMTHLTLKMRGNDSDTVTSVSPDCGIRNLHSSKLKPECKWTLLDEPGVYELHAHCHSVDFYQHPIKITEIERPLKVDKIHVTSIGARSANISWSTKETREQEYHVTVATQGSLIKNYTMWSNVSFDKLSPYTNYVINISSRYVTNGQWSDVKSDNFTTLSDVPEKHPEVSAGGWFNNGGNARCTNVDLLFKDIPDQAKNHGPSFKYDPRVEVHSKEDGSCFNCSNPRTKNRTVVIPTNCDVSVVVVSENQNGTARGKPQTIWIPHNVIPWPVNVTFIAINDNLVSVGWSPCQSASPTTGYTIYWQPKDGPEQYAFLTVGPEEDHALIPLPKHYIQFKFGMSRQMGNSSTGVKWMVDRQRGCIYDLRYAPARPAELEIKPGDNGQPILWETPVCAENTGYPYGYQISYRQHPATSQGSLGPSRFVPGTTDGKMKETLEELEDGTQYMVHIQSIAVGGRSVNVTQNFTYRAPDNRKNLHYLLIVLCVPVILVGSACFLWRCIIHVYKFCKGEKIKIREPPSCNLENLSAWRARPSAESNDYLTGLQDDSSGHTPGSRQKRSDHLNNNKLYSTIPGNDSTPAANLPAARDDSLSEGYIRMDGGKTDAVDYSRVGKNGLLVAGVPPSGGYIPKESTYLNSPPTDTNDCSVSCVHIRQQEFPQYEATGTNGYVVSTDSPSVDKHHSCHTSGYEPHDPTPDVLYSTDL